MSTIQLIHFCTAEIMQVGVIEDDAGDNIQDLYLMTEISLRKVVMLYLAELLK